MKWHFIFPLVFLTKINDNDLIIKNINVNQIGKIIIDNGKFLTIQKGRPYFFPNCQVDESLQTKNVKYKLISESHLPFKSSFQTTRSISLNYYDITKKVLNKKLNQRFSNLDSYIGSKIEIPKMFIKKSGNLYSSSIPIFIENFSIKSSVNPKSDCLNLTTKKQAPWVKKKKNHYSVFMKKSNLISNDWVFFVLWFSISLTTVKNFFLTF